jgi:flagellar protein FlaG
MSRIEATIATQISDAVRPRQAVRDVQLQTEQARVATLNQVNPAGTNASISSEDVRAVASQLKQIVESASERRLQFDVDEKSGEWYMIVRDSKTGEIIREIPSEQARKLRVQLQDIVGLLFNQKA